MPRNRYDKVLRLLPDTLAWSASADLSALSAFLLADDGLPRIFLGSGGSLSAAMLAMQLSVERRMVAAAMTPYQYVCSAWSRLSARVVIVSAGGRNVDALRAYAVASAAPGVSVGAVLMTPASTLSERMAADGNPCFAFGLSNADGFLATNSLVAFYSFFFRIYRESMPSAGDWAEIASVEESMAQFIGSTYELPSDGWDGHDASLYSARETDRFYLLYSPDTMPVAFDLESRFSEGAVGCLQLSDYRNFAHGRFNWFERRKGQTAVIALLTPESAPVAEGILSELPADIPVMRLATSLSGSDGIMNLLVKGMYLSKYLGMRWGLDIGAPKVADFGRVIHRKDFMESVPASSPDSGGGLVDIC